MSNSTEATPSGNDYRHTLNLPKTAFDMKANLTQREPKMLARWNEHKLYERIRHKPHPKGRWVLHDGPPYANGDIHLGHLINKVLKDIVIKYRTMQGYDAPFVPGWDCHGLPIESAVQKDLGPKMRQLPISEVRHKCRDYAQKYVKLQSESFRRLGVFGNFEHPYLTIDPLYEAGILDVLANLRQRDLVYRQRKPVHWCTSDQTALAEAELEYADRKDLSVYVKFALRFTADTWPKAWGAAPASAHLVIWTTTPWTLPANRAVAINPQHNYVCLRSSTNSDVLVVAAERASHVEHLISTFGYTAGKPDPLMQSDGKILLKLSGGAHIDELVGQGSISGGDVMNKALQVHLVQHTRSAPISGAAWLQHKPQYEHPLDAGRIQPVLGADYVTLDDGTGLVHTAPGHGTEDWQTGRRYGLDVYCPVLPDGRYDDTVPMFLHGQTIWQANALVAGHLKEKGLLLFSQEFNHSYPHCWRCRKPVIFRATEQWFVRASGQSSLMQNARKFVDAVEWIPAWGKNRISGMLDTRPDWCISRQRTWGVPIAAFFDIDGNILFSAKSIRQVADFVRRHGADAWYTHSPQAILAADTWEDQAITPDGEVLGHHRFNTQDLRKGGDILDVWFESGASHHAVLEGTHPQLGYPANMYLEGSDQHRGWFQASLLEAAGYRQEPPFKQVLTHGFVVDAQGRKMSKSLGNDIKVSDALRDFGADVLRLWVSSIDYQHDIPCSKDLLTRLGESYRKIRNTIRYLLGNLYDFDPLQHTCAPERHSVDTWMLGELSDLYANVHDAYDRYEFHRVFRLLHDFCNVNVSAIYAKAIKDRLYCELPNAPRRRASQTVCHAILSQLVQLIAPILAFTADETWQAILQLPGQATTNTTSIHEQIFLPPPPAIAEELRAPWQLFMPLIDDALKQLDTLKRSDGLGNPLDAEVVIVIAKGHSLADQMKFYGPEIEDVLGVGYHRFEHGELWALQIHDVRNKYASCARSWKRRPDVGSDRQYPDLSARDAGVMRQLGAGQS